MMLLSSLSSLGVVIIDVGLSWLSVLTTDGELHT